MNFRLALLVFATTLTARVPSLAAPLPNQWRVFTKADGLAENACVSVTLGASGNVLVRHAKSSAISVLDGYDISIVPGPDTNRTRVYESPGGQLWTVAPQGLLEFRDGDWALQRVPEIAEHFRAGRTNAIPLRPVRQGRVLILLPDRLLQLDAEDPDHARVELFRRAEQTALGAFTGLTPARDGGLWISGSRGFAKIPGPLRNVKPEDGWETTESVPPELQDQKSTAISPDEISVRRIYDVAVDPDGVVWLATSHGLFRRAPQIWETERQSPNGFEENGQKGKRAGREIRVPPALPEEISTRGNWKSYFAAKNGDLWLGGANEIAWRHRDSWRIFSSTNQIGPEDVVGFAEAPDGRIWCATPGKVWEFDGRNWLVLRGGFARINGLCGAHDGILWVATDDGIHRYSEGVWIANGPDDGLPAPMARSIFEDEPGRIWADTPAGFASFRPEADTTPPRTFMLADTGDNNFREGAAVTLSFRGRDKWKFTAANRLLFSYRLDEQDWSPFQEQRSVSFGELSLGKHYFQVRAMDRNGNIDSKPARLEFIVIVPWYRETRLVLILSIALGVAVFFAALAVNRHRRLRLSYAEVEQKIAERTRELEIANRGLLHSQKMNALGSLAAGIAHDFNNILSIVKGSAQIIEDNPGNPEKIRTRVDRIKTVVQQGAEVVEAMLGFSRSSDQPPAPCDLNAVVADTLKLLGDRFLREVEVRFERGENLPEISVLRDFVQQILLNFIFNAAESMSSRKQITLTTSLTDKLPPELSLAPARAASYVLISVRDSGSGIASEIKPRIFEPFFTTKALSTRRGTGLGLSMVYELAKKMETGLAVESIVGQGSTFTLILPVRQSNNTMTKSE